VAHVASSSESFPITRAFWPFSSSRRRAATMQRDIETVTNGAVACNEPTKQPRGIVFTGGLQLLPGARRLCSAVLAAAALAALPNGNDIGAVASPSPERILRRSVANFHSILDLPSVRTVNYRKFHQGFVPLELLGRGGFGEVWRCKQQLREQAEGLECAVKIVRFRAGNEAGPGHERRVAREAEMLSIMDHPNVVQHYESWIEPDWEGEAINGCIQEECESSIDLSSDSYTGGTTAGSSVVFLNEEPANKPGDSDQSSLGRSGPNFKQGHRQQTFAAEDAPQHTLYIQVELCRHETLQTWITARNLACSDITSDEAGAVSAKEARVEAGLSIFVQCAMALDHLHQQSCVHRDVKPANILFAQDGTLRLGDFGLAKPLPKAFEREPEWWEKSLDWFSQENASPLLEFSEGKIAGEQSFANGVGTPIYAAPEQLSGRPADTASDVFSLGVVLAELICPVKTQMERSIVLDDLRTHRSLPADVTSELPELASLILQMIELDPRRRPAVADVLSSSALSMSTS